MNQKSTRRRTSRSAIGCLLLVGLATGCSAYPEPSVKPSAAPVLVSDAPTPTKASVAPLESPPPETSPPDPTPTPAPPLRASTGLSVHPAGGIDSALVGGWYATYCAPTPTQCQNWGGNVSYAAVHSFHNGDRPYWIKVRYRNNEVRALVVSYCACGRRDGHQVIDLSPTAMAVLEPNYRVIGVLKNVEIEGLR